MAKVVKRSVLPIYAVAAVWLVFGLFLPLYQPLHYVTAAPLTTVTVLELSASKASPRAENMSCAVSKTE